jgi:hypothetical protein
MTRSCLLALEAGQRCREALLKLRDDQYVEDPVVDRAITMCDEIERHYDYWLPTRLHRWLGFVFGVLAARDVMTPGEQSAMMRELLVAYPEQADDDLFYHRDPGHPFQLDFGGEG